MCGIIGASSKNPINMSDVRLALYLADDRGGDSTGFTDGEYILRGTHNSATFLKPSDNITFPENFNKFIGHTRYATEGKKTLVNTHPFNFSGYIGVHNGTITNFKTLRHTYGGKALKKLKDMFPEKEKIQKLKSIESDSLLLYYMISEEGLETVLPKLKGTMGLAYFDPDSRLNIYRFHKPLCYGFKDGELWYASMRSYLETLGCHRIKPFTQHTRYIIEEGNVVESTQLKTDLLPKESVTQKEDLDPDFKKEEQMKGLPEKKSKAKSNPTNKGGSSNTTKDDDGSKDDVVNDPVANSSRVIPDDGYNMPLNAKAGLTEDGKVILWSFSPTKPGVLYVEVETYQDILRYDLNLESDRLAFKADCPEIKEDVEDEQVALELALDVRNDKSAYVKYQ